MPVYPPVPNITNRDLEVLMDALAYILQTDSRTSGIKWILGEPGMGRPPAAPFGFIHPQTEMVAWTTANGGAGGLAAGLDDWNIPILLTVAVEPHREPNAPVAAAPPASSPFATANLGIAVPYQEQPGWRKSLEMTQKISAVLRTGANPVIGGAAAATRIVENRYVLMDIDGQVYRTRRLSLQTQQRRLRGN